MCSTPYGIRESSRTAGGGSEPGYGSAQRLTASENPAAPGPVQFDVDVVVLNALRHQRIQQKTFYIRLDQAGMCSTPYGIRESSSRMRMVIQQLWPGDVLNALRHQRIQQMVRRMIRCRGWYVLNALRHQRIQQRAGRAGPSDLHRRAQRLTASENPAAADSRVAGEGVAVLNALRHQRIQQRRTQQPG